MAKYYITTAIDYVNARPHVGHALEKIQADVLARFHRQRGDDVLFLAGTDEHGAKVAQSAAAAGKSPKEFVDEVSKSFQDLKDTLNLSTDNFIRTTDENNHWPGAVKIWKELDKSGDIYKRQYKGLYCVGHEAFVTEKDLEDGKCRDHQAAPEIIEEENYFFRLSRYSNEIGKRIKNGDFLILPKSRANEILSLIDNGGLEDVSFSRPRKDLAWGIPVPGDDSQTMYVWCDALVNYISAIGYGRSEDYKKFWPADAQVIGKDILRFHAAIWPGMLLSSGLPLPKKLLVHGFVTSGGKKMSKTIGNVLDPVDLIMKFGVDPIRYYLLKEIPSGEDGDFGEDKFKLVYNGELANGLGNFSARVTSLGEKLGEFPADKVEREVQEKIKNIRELVEENLENFRIHEALGAIWELISFGDGYINKNKVWEDIDGKVGKIFNLVVILDNVTALLKPFLPETAGKIEKRINWTSDKTLRVTKGEILFPRIEE